MTPVLERNIRTLLEHRAREEQSRGLQDRAAAAVTRFTGSMKFVWLHVVIVTIWIGWNADWMPLPKFDDTLVILAMAASVEAIFLSTFILITQNRMAALADKRADLDLQISLLAEHEITRMLVLVSAMARKMELAESHDPELQQLARDVRPEAVLHHIENPPAASGTGAAETQQRADH